MYLDQASCCWKCSDKWNWTNEKKSQNHQNIPKNGDHGRVLDFVTNL